MPEASDKTRPVHRDLDTAYVNVGALLRYLRQRDFAGRVHVELDEYDADIFLRGRDEPRVVERNHSTGREETGDAALHRLLVRAREPGGLVSVYEEESDEATTVLDEMMKRAGIPNVAATQGAAKSPASAVSEEESEQHDLLLVCGELIAAVERAAEVAGGDFPTAFHHARISLADDYPFLDPVQRRFEYAEGVAHLRGKASTGLFVSGISEALRRVVERVASEGEKIGVRRDVAREFSTLMRRRQTALTRFKFTPHLERIAGMRLL